MQIDNNLMEIISRVESSNNSLACRYEPGFHDMLKNKPNIAADMAVRNCIKYNDCNFATALALCSMSFGRYQIMAYNLYLDGYIMSIRYFWQSGNEQDNEFLKFIKTRGINFTWQNMKANQKLLMQFAKVYNGDINAYSEAMLRAAQDLGIN